MFANVLGHTLFLRAGVNRDEAAVVRLPGSVLNGFEDSSFELVLVHRRIASHRLYKLRRLQQQISSKAVTLLTRGSSTL